MNKNSNEKLQALYKEINKILPEEIEYDDFSLLVDETSKYIYRSEEFYSISKSKIFKKIDDYLSPKVVIDIGANNGFNTILFSKRFNKAKIIAVEPNPKLIKYIEQNIILNSVDNVNIVESIIGNEDQKSICFQINKSLSVDSRVCGLNENFENIIVKTTTINKLIELHNENNNVFIKIDTQGYEKHVINGFSENLWSFDFLILMEFAPYWLECSGTNPETFFSELCEKFTVCELPKYDLFKDEPIVLMKNKNLDSIDAKSFVKYVESSGKNKRGWCDLLLFKK